MAGKTAGDGKAGVERNASGRRIKADGLSAEKRAMFLEVLGRTFSVDAAAEAVGADVSAFRYLRARDEAFAAAWARAYEDGAEMIDGLIARASLGLPVPEGFNPEMALAVLQRWRARGSSAEHQDRRAGNVSRVKRVPIAQVEAEILRRLAALKKQRAQARVRRGK